MERRRLVGRQAPPPAYRIRGVFEELNFPSIDKLKTALKKRGIRFTDDEIDAANVPLFVRGQDSDEDGDQEMSGEDQDSDPDSQLASEDEDQDSDDE